MADLVITDASGKVIEQQHIETAHSSGKPSAPSMNEGAPKSELSRGKVIVMERKP